jgi:hypothetical protein
MATRTIVGVEVLTVTDCPRLFPTASGFDGVPCFEDLVAALSQPGQTLR